MVMRFAIQHGIGEPNWSPSVLDPHAMADFARATEESGWDALAFTDHPAPSSRWARNGGEGSAEPFGALAFCAAVTSSVRLLTSVLVLPYRNPLFTAHQIATLDALSGGRVIIGAGTGYLRGEFHAVGADFAHRREDFDDAVAVFQDGWTVDELARAGRGYEAKGNVLQPRPLQLPRPPLWIHGNGAWGTERAARADGWMIMMTSEQLARTVRTRPARGLAAVREGIARLREALDRAERPHTDVEIVVAGNWPLLDVRVGWDRDRYLADVAELEELGVTWLVNAVIGDDAAASQETARRFGEEIVRAGR